MSGSLLSSHMIQSITVHIEPEVAGGFLSRLTVTTIIAPEQKA